MPDYKYTSEYSSIFLRLKPIQQLQISTQLNFSDYHLDTKTDDKFSYIFRIVSTLNKNYKIKFSWYSLDLIEKNEEDTIDFNVYTTKIQNKWKLELNISF